MLIVIFRTLFIITSIFFTVLFYSSHSLTAMIISGTAAGVAALGVIIAIEYVSHSFQSRQLLSAIIGLLIGLIAAHLFVTAINSFELDIIRKYSGIIKPLLYHISGFAMMIFFLINHEDISFLDKIITPGVIKFSIQV